MAKKTIYTVIKVEGTYEDRYSHPIKAFTNKAKAEAFVNEKQEYYDNLQERYDVINIDIDDAMAKITHEYIKDTNKEFYKALLKAEATNDEEEFAWDDYYDIMDKLEDNENLLKEYIKKCNFTNEEAKMILTETEFNKIATLGSLPYVYVDNNPIELED